MEPFIVGRVFSASTLGYPIPVPLVLQVATALTSCSEAVAQHTLTFSLFVPRVNIIPRAPPLISAPVLAVLLEPTATRWQPRAHPVQLGIIAPPTLSSVASVQPLAPLGLLPVRLHLVFLVRRELLIPLLGALLLLPVEVAQLVHTVFLNRLRACSLPLPALPAITRFLLRLAYPVPQVPGVVLGLHPALYALLENIIH
jgi:hypothetical protein